MNGVPHRVVILGSSGMLGSMLRFHFEKNPRFVVRTVARPRFDAEVANAAGDVPEIGDADYVLNGIGIIKPFCKDDDAVGVERAIAVNAFFPHVLARAAANRGARLVQIATDCVYSGATGAYRERDLHDPLDVYGKTKSLGELHVPGSLNVRCSIVGPETGRHASLLEWLLSQPERGRVDGYAHHRWNGVTTLQFARLCERIIETPGAFDALRAVAPTHHFVPNEMIGKDELLRVMARAYEKVVDIRPVDDIGPPIDRTLSSDFTQLSELFGSESMSGALGELAAATPAYRRASRKNSTIA